MRGSSWPSTPEASTHASEVVVGCRGADPRPPRHRRVERPDRRPEPGCEVKRCGHGFRSFKHYRLRVLLHAGGVTWPARPQPPRIRTRSPHSFAQSQITALVGPAAPYVEPPKVVDAPPRSAGAVKPGRSRNGAPKARRSNPNAPARTRKDLEARAG